MGGSVRPRCKPPNLQHYHHTLIHKTILYIPSQTLKHVESAIHAANLPGISPQKHSSRTLRIPISRPTNETRMAIEKMIADQGEAAKVRLRGARGDALKALVDKDGRKGKWGTEVRGWGSIEHYMGTPHADCENIVAST